MAASLNGVFPATLQDQVKQSKILVVGAGGIGCEILKNLVLSGFPHIEIIDLDTIDLSNLNRQFLFHREHVGRSKAEVARESALKFNPDVNIKAYHDSIMASNFGVNFFKKFNVVLNALDNRAARNHVNRMCLNADVPLIESGTAGYNGQVEIIKKGLTQCYECTPKAKQKTFPGCTIRNTPSEPIHCIVWAKHLFNQLFGETVDDEDISPDIADPELISNNNDDNGEIGDTNGKEDISDSGNIVRINTREWAKECNFEAAALFNKFFNDDINYLLTMSNLWKTRKPPTPIKWDSVLLQRGDANGAEQDFMRQYHKVWSLAECTAIFEECIKKLSSMMKELPEGEAVVWDKDDQPAMDFVAACANIRAFIFDIGRKSRFEMKSMAGNIIPAIATTNAITAGVVILHTFKVLQNEIDKCKSVYMRLRLNGRQQLIVPEKFLSTPNADCVVCSKEPAIYLKIDTKRMRIKEFKEEVLIKALNMVNPDVIDGNKGSIIISSDGDETECNEMKFMNELDIIDGSLLKCDDFFQNYELSIIIIDIDAKRDESLFEVIADKTQLKPKEEEEKQVKQHANGAHSAEAEKDDNSDGPSTSKRQRITEVPDDDDDDLCIVEDDDDVCVVESETDLCPKFVDLTDKLKVSSPDKATKNDSVKSAAINIENGDVKVTEILDSDEDDEPCYGKRARTTTLIDC